MRPLDYRQIFFAPFNFTPASFCSSLIPPTRRCTLRLAGTPRPYSSRLRPANHSLFFHPKPDPAAILDPSRTRRAISRLGLFASHLAQTQKPILELNTPFSVERTSSPEDHAEIIADESRKILEVQQAEALKEQEKHLKKEIEAQKEKKRPAIMSTQEPHPALLIPGPIEVDDAVLQSMSHFR
jgi:hypothetical protein